MCPSYMATQRRGALDPGPRQRAPRRAVRPPAGGRVHRPAPLRGHGPLPGVQGLQGGVSVERGHGEAQVRVPPPLLPGQRAAAPQPAVRTHRADESAGLSRAGALQLDARAWPRAAGLLEKLAGIDRRRPLPSLATQTFTDWFARHTPPAAAPRGEVVLFNDTFMTYNVPDIGARRRGGARGGRLPCRARGPQVLRPPAHLQGDARRGARARRLERVATGTLRAARGGHRRPRALVPLDPARRDRGPRAHRRRAGRGAAVAPPRGVSRCASAPGG